MPLIHTPNIPDPDGFYEELINSQRELSDEQVELMNAKLILVLAKQVVDRATLSDALALARPKT